MTTSQPPPAGGLSPDKPTAPHRSLSFPPEVLLLVLSFASDSYIGGEAETLNARNAELARIALVSRAFQAATYSVLYGDLRLPWMADTVKQLRKSFSKNSQLLPLVRRLEASAVDEYAWVEDDYDSRSSDEQVREEWLESYCERNGIEEESDEWIGLNENPIEDGDAADDFEDDMRSDAKMAWSASGHGAWQAKRTNPEGALEVLDFVGSAPALRRLVVRDFLTPLRAVDLAKRGSYPLIESLVLPQDSPFLADGRLAPFLVSRAPNLRSLSGYADQTHRTGDTSCPFISIPPSLTSLRFIGYDQDDPRIEPLLLQAQPRLRSLFLMPGIPGWAAGLTLASCLSSVETLIINHRVLLRDGDEVQSLDINSLASAIATSTSLRHLELGPATATLFPSLPPSLSSLVLLLDQEAALSPTLEMKRVLALLKAASVRPLRVEFAPVLAETLVKVPGQVAWDEIRGSYAAEGHVLSLRSFRVPVQ